MKAQIRQKEIYNYLQNHHEVSISTLKKHFGVSDMTIRRDLDVLEQFDMVHRSYGKVTLAAAIGLEQPFISRRQINIEAKRKIAETALGQISNMTSFYIDGSTTCLSFAEMLPYDKAYTIFTNNLETVQVLQKKPLVTIFLIGGVFMREMNTCDSSTSLSQLKNVFVDASFISCSGFNRHGTANNSIRTLSEHRAMIENSEKTFLLADNSKFNKRGLVPAEIWQDIDTLITDGPFDPTEMDVIRQKNVEIIWS